MFKKRENIHQPDREGRESIGKVQVKKKEVEKARLKVLEMKYIITNMLDILLHIFKVSSQTSWPWSTSLVHNPWNCECDGFYSPEQVMWQGTGDLKRRRLSRWAWPHHTSPLKAGFSLNGHIKGHQRSEVWWGLVYHCWLEDGMSPVARNVGSF